MRVVIAYWYGQSLKYMNQDNNPSEETVQQHFVQQQIVDAICDPNVPEKVPSPMEDWINGNQILGSEYLALC